MSGPAGPATRSKPCSPNSSSVSGSAAYDYGASGMSASSSCWQPSRVNKDEQRLRTATNGESDSSRIRTLHLKTHSPGKKFSDRPRFSPVSLVFGMRTSGLVVFHGDITQQAGRIVHSASQALLCRWLGRE